MKNLGEAVCPYYRKELGTVLHCELATFKFPDLESKAQIKVYCCDVTGCKECPMYKILDAYYIREYEKGTE